MKRIWLLCISGLVLGITASASAVEFEVHGDVNNRFLIYTLFPDANVSLRIAWGPNREFVVATVGHSIFNRTSSVHVGGLLAKYGGGGHKGAGATPLNRDEADELIVELIDKLNESPFRA